MRIVEVEVEGLRALLDRAGVTPATSGAALRAQVAALAAEPPPPPAPPRWTAVDGDTRVCLLDGDQPGALLLHMQDGQQSMSVRLPDPALRRGALAVGAYLVERADGGDDLLALALDLDQLATLLQRRAEQ